MQPSRQPLERLAIQSGGCDLDCAIALRICTRAGSANVKVHDSGQRIIVSRQCKRLRCLNLLHVYAGGDWTGLDQLPLAKASGNIKTDFSGTPTQHSVVRGKQMRRELDVCDQRIPMYSLLSLF